MKHEDLVHVRVETGLDFRILRIITLFTCSALPWLIMIPHYFNKGPVSITMLPELDELRKKAFRKWVKDSQGRQYEVVYDAELPDNIDEILQAFFVRVAELRNLFINKQVAGGTHLCGHLTMTFGAMNFGRYFTTNSRHRRDHR